MDRDLRVRSGPPAWVVVVDIIAKVLLLLIAVRVALDPGWGNLEGKAPGTRAATYPLLALLLPVVFLVRGARGRFPWAADLLVTIPAFSDVLGNRLDMYDRVVWFDDLMHFVNTGLLCGAVLVLCGASRAPLRRRLELSLATGMTMALAWEVWEYFAFVARSQEVVTAYGDTVGDLALGWAGAVAAALLVGAFRGREAPAPDIDQMKSSCAPSVFSMKSEALMMPSTSSKRS